MSKINQYRVNALPVEAQRQADSLYWVKDSGTNRCHGYVVGATPAEVREVGLGQEDLIDLEFHPTGPIGAGQIIKAGTELYVALMDFSSQTWTQPIIAASSGFTKVSSPPGNALDERVFLSYLGKQQNGSLLLDTQAPFVGNDIQPGIVRVGVSTVGAPGALHIKGYTSPTTSTELLPVNPAQKYRISMAMKPLNYATVGSKGLYLYMNYFDIDKHGISIANCSTAAVGGADKGVPFADHVVTVLAYDEQTGVLTVDDASRLIDSANLYHRCFRALGYKNSFGDEYAIYSRNISNSNAFDQGGIDTANNTVQINLARVGWFKQFYTPGQRLVQNYYGGTYKYSGYKMVDDIADNEWFTLTGYPITGFDVAGEWSTYKFPQGTAYASVGMLVNYDDTGGKGEAHITNITFQEASAF